MKKFTSLLLCLMLVLSVAAVPAAAEQGSFGANVTMENGIVTVTVSAAAVANARLHVDFDPAYLTYESYETAFAVHSVRADGGRLEIGLANASDQKLDELMVIRFQVTGAWDRTEITVTTERLDGVAVNETLAVTVEGTGCRFVDVQPGQWFYEAVDHMAAEGYINGISATHFGPGLNMNRASFVTLLGRLEGVEEKRVQTPFTDVPMDSFYSGYVAWAVENGITNGISVSMFGPAEPINRAQMVTFLYRYAKYKGQDVSVENAAEILKGYADGEQVAAIGWAAEPFAWAVENGVINGMGGRLNPDGTANRAQVAVMLYRFFFEN